MTEKNNEKIKDELDESVTDSIKLKDENDDESLEIEGDENDDENDDENYNTSMQIGAAIHKQSDILKRFPQLAKEVKYSFFNEIDKKHFYMRSRTYQDLNYMKTIFNLSYLENVSMQTLRKSLYLIKKKEDFKTYLDSTNQTYLWYSFKYLSEEDFKILLKQLKEIKEDGIINSMYSQNTFVKNVYGELAEGNIIIDDVDEMGLINDIYTVTEGSKAKGGNERKSINTTISVTSEQNEREEQQEHGENIFVKKAKSFMFGNKPKPTEEQD